MTFKNLNLHPNILKAIEEMGYSTPTPIQEMVIPKISSGVDIQASAQTGTGKTAAFLLPILHRLINPSASRVIGPRALILVPTRELAMQVATECARFSKYIPRMKCVCIFGGAPYPVQNRELKRPYEILVATPGRLIDHLSQGRIDFSRLETLILDEADRMLDMGFIEPVEQIAAATPKERQTLLFSATLKGPVLNLSKRLLNKPVEVHAAAVHEKHEHIQQKLHYVDNIGHKHRLLDHLLTDPTMNQAIVFTSTKINADQLVDTLFAQGHNAAALHGDMNQRQRTRTIAQLRHGQIRVLVATDIVARGIDVQTISHVINFDLPNNAEDYVHRIGRTGRAGSKGVALSFAAGKDLHLVKRIEQFTGQPIELYAIPGFEAQQKMVATGRPKPNSFGRPFGRGPGRPSGASDKRPGRQFGRPPQRAANSKETRFR
jgi:superfamily II DNA/RNA helicase